MERRNILIYQKDKFFLQIKLAEEKVDNQDAKYADLMRRILKMAYGDEYTSFIKKHS